METDKEGLIGEKERFQVKSETGERIRQVEE